MFHSGSTPMEDPENFEYLYTELTIDSKNTTHIGYCSDIDRSVVVRQEMYPKFPCIFPFELLDIVFSYLCKSHEIEQEWTGCEECSLTNDSFIKVTKKRRLKRHHACTMIKRKQINLPHYIESRLYNDDDVISNVSYYPVYHQPMSKKKVGSNSSCFF